MLKLNFFTYLVKSLQEVAKSFQRLSNNHKEHKKLRMINECKNILYNIYKTMKYKTLLFFSLEESKF